MTSGTFLGRRSKHTLLRVPRNERLGSFGITTREINAAHRAISRVRTESSAGVIEFRTENVFAVAAGADAVINDERQHDSACGFLAVGNIFTPTSAPGSVSANPIPGTAPISAVMSKLTFNLFRTMICGGARHSDRKR
jgi:hypothetical protein